MQHVQIHTYISTHSLTCSHDMQAHTHIHTHTLPDMLARHTGSHAHSLTCSHDIQADTHIHAHSLTCLHDIQADTHIHTLYCCTHTYTHVQLNTLLLTLIVPVEIL